MGKFHHALPMTAALCLAAAVGIPGTLPAALAPPRDDTTGDLEIRIAHPKGTAVVRTHIDRVDDDPTVTSVGVTRTARRLLAGTAYLHPNGRRS